MTDDQRGVRYCRHGFRYAVCAVCRRTAGGAPGESIDIPSGTGWRLTGPEGELIAESIPLTPEHHAAAEAAYERLRGAGVLELPASLTDTYQLGTHAAATLLQLAGAAIEAENEQALQGVWDELTDSDELPGARLSVLATDAIGAVLKVAAEIQHKPIDGIERFREIGYVGEGAES